METIRDILKWVFVYLLYPAVAFGVFICLITLLIFIVRRAKSTSGAIRRTTGAALPVVMLVFLMSTGQDTTTDVTNYLDQLGPVGRILVGIGAAVLVMETGKHLGSTDATAAISTYAFFVSSLLAVLLWVIMGGLLQTLNYAMFAFVLTGGLHVMFRGLPGWFDTGASE